MDASYAGFLNGDAPAVLSGLACTALDGRGRTVGTSMPAETYIVTCTGTTAANYTISYLAGSLMIKHFTAGTLLALSQDGNSCHLLLNGGTLTAGSVAVDGTSSSALCMNGGMISVAVVTVQGGIVARVFRRRLALVPSGALNVTVSPRY